jgi:hypothetical protein
MADVAAGPAIPGVGVRQSVREVEKVILVPSGDHAGHPSAPGASVSCLRPDPSAFITKMS